MWRMVWWWCGDGSLKSRQTASGLSAGQLVTKTGHCPVTRNTQCVSSPGPIIAALPGNKSLSDCHYQPHHLPSVSLCPHPLPRPVNGTTQAPHLKAHFKTINLTLEEVLFVPESLPKICRWRGAAERLEIVSLDEYQQEHGTWYVLLSIHRQLNKSVSMREVLLILTNLLMKFLKTDKTYLDKSQQNLQCDINSILTLCINLTRTRRHILFRARDEAINIQWGWTL